MTSRRKAFFGHLRRDTPKILYTYVLSISLCVGPHLEQTYVGTILISINPYKLLPIYASNTVQRYVNKRVGAAAPHIFALAEAAYRTLEETGRPQSIVIRSAHYLISHASL